MEKQYDNRLTQRESEFPVRGKQAARTGLTLISNKKQFMSSALELVSTSWF